MNILITGGMGNLGSRLIVPLVRRGDRVTVFDLRPTPHAATVEFHQVIFVRGDLADRQVLIDAVHSHQIESIFHLGAVLSGSAEDNPSEAWSANMTGMVNVLDAARLGGAKKVIFSSTIATYGSGIDELHDDSPQWPISLYGVTKVAGERLGVYYLEKHGVDFRGIRLPAVIAPGGSDGGVSAYCSAAFEQSILQGSYDFFVKPETRAPMVYIADAVQAMLSLHDVPAKRLTRRMYNIAAMALSANDLANAIWKRLPDVKITYTPDPLRTAIVESWPAKINDTEARRDWNWKPSWDLPRITDEIIAVLGEKRARQ